MAKQGALREYTPEQIVALLNKHGSYKAVAKKLDVDQNSLFVKAKRLGIRVVETRKYFVANASSKEKTVNGDKQ